MFRSLEWIKGVMDCSKKKIGHERFFFFFFMRKSDLEGQHLSCITPGWCIISILSFGDNLLLVCTSNFDVLFVCLFCIKSAFSLALPARSLPVFSVPWNEQPAISISFLLSSTVLRLGIVWPSVFQLWVAGTNKCYSPLLVDKGDSSSTLSFPVVSSFDNLVSCHQLSMWDREQEEKMLFWGGQEKRNHYQ